MFHSHDSIVSDAILLLFTFAACAVFSSPAFADLKGTMCGAFNMLKGDVAPGVATVAVVGLGVAATFGRVSPGLVVSTAIGIAALFNVDQVASILGGSC